MLQFPRSKVIPEVLTYGEPKYVPGKGLFIGNEESEPEQISGSGGSNNIKETIDIITKTSVVTSFYVITTGFNLVFINGMLQDEGIDYVIADDKKTINFTDELTSGSKVILVYSPTIVFDTISLTNLQALTSNLIGGTSQDFVADKYPGAIYSWFVNNNLVKTTTSNIYNHSVDSVGTSQLNYSMQLFDKTLVSNTIPFTAENPFCMIQNVPAGLATIMGLQQLAFDSFKFDKGIGAHLTTENQITGWALKTPLNQGDTALFSFEITNIGDFDPNQTLYYQIVSADSNSSSFANIGGNSDVSMQSTDGIVADDITILGLSYTHNNVTPCNFIVLSIYSNNETTIKPSFKLNLISLTPGIPETIK